jgi:hypothetical protein
VLDALALQRRAGVSADDEQLASLAAALELVPVEAKESSPGEDSPDDRALAEALPVRCPMGSYQNQPLSRVVADGEAGARWLTWALQQPWTQDPRFKEALHVVGQAEGLVEASDVSAEDDAPDDAPANSGEEGSDG